LFAAARIKCKPRNVRGIGCNWVADEALTLTRRAAAEYYDILTRWARNVTACGDCPQNAENDWYSLRACFL